MWYSHWEKLGSLLVPVWKAVQIRCSLKKGFIEHCDLICVKKEKLGQMGYHVNIGCVCLCACVCMCVCTKKFSEKKFDWVIGVNHWMYQGDNESMREKFRFLLYLSVLFETFWHSGFLIKILKIYCRIVSYKVVFYF